MTVNGIFTIIIVPTIMIIINHTSSTVYIHNTKLSVSNPHFKASKVLKQSNHNSNYYTTCVAALINDTDSL